mmetsp:Transcript_13305/g.46023  ORF Transcript_13305/g.46023 Transcript_13305/m.46023 type:complete len:347 (-) Transcript_13305:728-1768(-)
MITFRFQPTATTTRTSRWPSETYISAVTSCISSSCVNVLSSCPLLKFHIRTVPSFAAVSRRRSERSKHSAVSFEAPCAWLKRLERWPSSSCHTLTVPASSPLTTSPKLDVYAAAHSGCSCPVYRLVVHTCGHAMGCVVHVTSLRRLESYRQLVILFSGLCVSSSVNVWMHLWFRRSHTFTVLSMDTDMSWLRWSSTSTSCTLAAWPTRLPTLRPVAPCHSSTSRSSPHDAKSEYALHQSKLYTPFLWTLFVKRTFRVWKSVSFSVASRDPLTTALSSGTYITLLTHSLCWLCSVTVSSGFMYRLFMSFVCVSSSLTAPLESPKTTLSWSCTTATLRHMGTPIEPVV